MSEWVATVDVFLRGGAVAVLVNCALVFFFSRRGRIRDVSVPSLCVGVAAYLLVSSPNIGLAASSVEGIFVAIASLVPILAVWSAAEIFFDRPTYQRWHGVVAAAVVACAGLAPFVPNLLVVRSVLIVLLYAALFTIALTTAAGDLVESRRRFRRWFVAIMALTGLGISSVELLRLDANLPMFVYPLHAFGLLVLASLFAFWATQIAPDIWPLLNARSSTFQAELSPAETAVLQRLKAVLATGLWRTEGLSIAQLSAAVHAPEHRVRHAINMRLGYRNFAQFINEQRIVAAKEVLSDPARGDIPILSVAYDVGFSSLGPFNRAFREVTGQSPTEYRRSNSE